MGPPRELLVHLECPICKRVYDAPVSVISCLHTYCSICIRLYISQTRDKTCPMCKLEGKKQLREGIHFVKNPLLGDLVDSCFNMIDKTRESEYPEFEVHFFLKKLREETKSNASHLSLNSEDDFQISEQIGASATDELIHGVLKSNFNHKSDSCSTLKTKNPSNPLLQSATTTKSESLSDNNIIPSRNYRCIPIEKLKDEIAKFKLSTSGDVKLLIWRHKMYSIYFNANIDRSDCNRLSKAAVRWLVLKEEHNRLRHTSELLSDINNDNNGMKQTTILQFNNVQSRRKRKHKSSVMPHSHNHSTSKMKNTSSNDIQDFKSNCEPISQQGDDSIPERPKKRMRLRIIGLEE